MTNNAKPAVSGTVRGDVLPPCSGPCIDCGKHVQVLACYQVVRWTGDRKPIVERPLCGDCYRKRRNAIGGVVGKSGGGQ
jgi:hypothetical protein